RQKQAEPIRSHHAHVQPGKDRSTNSSDSDGQRSACPAARRPIFFSRSRNSFATAARSCARQYAQEREEYEVHDRSKEKHGQPGWLVGIAQALYGESESDPDERQRCQKQQDSEAFLRA